MTKRTFRTFTGGIAAEVTFLLVWSVGFGGLPLYFLITQQGARINGKMQPANQAWPVLLFMALIGLVVFLYAMQTLLNSTVHRVEIEGEEIRWFDWKGQLKVKARSDEIIGFEGGSLFSSSTGCTILTPSGNIKVVSSVKDLGLLKSILRCAKSGFSTWESQMKGPFPDQYVPNFQKFDYRVSIYLPSGFIVVGFVAFLFYQSFSLGPFNGPNYSAPLGAQIFILLLGTPGYWMLLTFWNEKITLGPDGIAWQNWSGKKLSATLDEIIDFDYKKTRPSKSGATSEVIRIFTLKGTISFTSAMGDSPKLRKEIEKLIKSRSSKLPDSQEVLLAP